MQEHKCPKCGNVFSNGICCNKCGTVFLFEDEYAKKQNPQDIKKINDNYEMANEIMSKSPENDFEGKRREIIEDLIRQRKEREEEKRKQLEEQRIQRERELALQKAREEARIAAEKKAKEEAEKKAEEEARIIAEQKRIEEERIIAEREKAENEAKKLEEEKKAEIKEESESKEKEQTEDIANEENDVNDEGEESVSIEMMKTRKYTGLIKQKSDENASDEENAYSDEENSDFEEDNEIAETENYDADSAGDDGIEDNPENENFCDDEESGYEYDNPMPQVSRDLYSDDVIKGDTLFVKFLRKTLILFYTLTLIAVFMPFTKLVEMSSVYSISLIDFVVVFPLLCGLIITIAEKKFIKKFIFATIVSAVYLLGYIMLKKVIVPKSISDIVYFVLFGGIFLISVTALIADRNPAFKKFCVWFDSFVYLIFFVNMFCFIFMGLIWLVAPGFVAGTIRIYVIAIMLITLINIVSCILMAKRKSGGADLFLAASIMWIFLVIVGYNQMMNSVGYRINFEYMHTIGTAYSYFIASCVVFPIIMFIWLRMIKAKEKKQE